MSAWSLKRKVTILALIFGVAFFFIVIIGVRAFKTEPTCFDGKQNGDERGVDCGGVCERICPFDALNIIPLWSRSFWVTDDVYNAVAYIENQNANAGVKNIHYRFRLYDENNVIITERFGNTFIGPNARSAIFESGIKTGNRIPKKTFFEFIEQPQWVHALSSRSAQTLAVKSVTLANETTAPKLSATIENSSLEDVFDVTLIAILYDVNGVAVNTSKTYVDVVPRGSSRAIVFTWPTPFDRPVVKNEIIPRVNVFTPGNI